MKKYNKTPRQVFHDGIASIKELRSFLKLMLESNNDIIELSEVSPKLYRIVVRTSEVADKLVQNGKFTRSPPSTPAHPSVYPSPQQPQP